MKKNLFTFVIALLMGIGIVQAQSASQQVSNLLDDYYELKDALVASDGKQAELAAKEMLNSFQAIEAGKFRAEQAKTFNSIRNDLGKDIKQIAATQDIKEQREYFTTLSENMITLVKAVDTEQTVYVQRCPMANKHRGGSWLSTEKEVRNPYYGKMMLKCGSVKDTL
jgi:hypothetical protein